MGLPGWGSTWVKRRNALDKFTSSLSHDQPGGNCQMHTQQSSADYLWSVGWHAGFEIKTFNFGNIVNDKLYRSFQNDIDRNNQENPIAVMATLTAHSNASAVPTGSYGGSKHVQHAPAHTLILNDWIIKHHLFQIMQLYLNYGAPSN